MTVRLAMWSGPRNISTAMMRAWEHRADTVVIDEPLYAHYLLSTGRDHPGRDEVLAHHETDWRRAVAHLLAPLSEGASIFYQKHMAHHLLPHIELDWLDQLTHAFLIRDPREMLTSLVKNIPNPTVEETGLPQQVQLFERIRTHRSTTPPILDSRDVLTNPRRLLTGLCEAVNVPFDEHMLHWPAGSRESDGIWAKHWYASVERSTGFQPYAPKQEPVPNELRSLLDECMGYYEALYEHRLR